MSQLTPCPNCRQHIRLTEEKCPFCQAPLQGLIPQPIQAVDSRMTAPMYGGPEMMRPATKYGGPPGARAMRSLVLVGGVVVVVYIIVHLVR